VPGFKSKRLLAQSRWEGTEETSNLNKIKYFFLKKMKKIFDLIKKPA
jgi:hypothetical protein